MNSEPQHPIDPALFDLGHQGEVDVTQIDAMLALTPTQRLDKHEEWRLFVKEALHHTALRQANTDPANRGTR
jgi:hypothetical protein